MRKDMSKVLVLTPRHGSWKKNQESKLLNRKFRDCEDLDELPRRQGMKPRVRTCSRKELNENLTPLIRFLRSNVGRPWDKVYSEICAHMDRNSAIQAHIFQHLWDFVERHPVKIDGVWHEPRMGWRRIQIPIRAGHFYVGNGGLLQEGKGTWPHSHREKVPEGARVRWSDFTLLCREKGIWYRYVVDAKLPKNFLHLLEVGRVIGETGVWLRGYKYQSRFEKKQLNKKELVQYHLNNDPETE